MLMLMLICPRIKRLGGQCWALDEPRLCLVMRGVLGLLGLCCFLCRIFEREGEYRARDYA